VRGILEGMGLTLHFSVSSRVSRRVVVSAAGFLRPCGRRRRSVSRRLGRGRRPLWMSRRVNGWLFGFLGRLSCLARRCRAAESQRRRLCAAR
jgi:hypothetical protein